MALSSRSKLSLAGRLCVSLLPAALVCGGFYLFWYRDALYLEHLKLEILTHQRRSIRALEVMALKLPEFQREVCLLEARKKTLKGDPASTTRQQR